jgi:ATP-dependent Clp protease ATP-binding subunit ClpA
MELSKLTEKSQAALVEVRNIATRNHQSVYVEHLMLSLLELELTEPAKEHGACEGYDPVYGARPLKRYLQRHIGTPLSRKLISGEMGDHSRGIVDFKSGELVFRSTPLEEAKAA